MKRIAILAALAALAAAAAPFAAPARPSAQPQSRGLSKTELRRLPPAETHRRLRDTIWEMFEKEDFRSDQPPRRPLDSLVLRTRVRSAGLRGLCRYDSVVVRFVPAERRAGREPGPETPMRAAGVETDARFLFLVPPETYSGDEPPDRSAAADAACAEVDTARRDSFSAPDEEIANDAMLALLRIQQALRRRNALPLRCELGANDTATCEAVVLALDPAAVEFVSRCRAAERQDLCFEIDVGDRLLEIDTTPVGAAGPPPILPLRLRLTTPIVFRDQRID